MVNTKAQMVACVHDEIILEVEEEQTPKAQQILQRVMVSAGQHYLTEVPVVVEATMADNWAGKWQIGRLTGHQRPADRASPVLTRSVPTASSINGKRYQAEHQQLAEIKGRSLLQRLNAVLGANP